VESRYNNGKKLEVEKELLELEARIARIEKTVFGTVTHDVSDYRQHDFDDNKNCDETNITIEVNVGINKGDC
jgi:hypothetical protein